MSSAAKEEWVAREKWSHGGLFMVGVVVVEPMRRSFLLQSVFIYIPPVNIGSSIQSIQGIHS